MIDFHLIADVLTGKLDAREPVAPLQQDKLDHALGGAHAAVREPECGDELSATEAHDGDE